jgi:hypothetical protein
MKMEKLLILVLLLGVASGAWADTVDWLNTPVDRDWFNAANWVWGAGTLPLPGVPTAISEVRMHRSSAAPYGMTAIIAVGDAVASVINIGGVGANAEPYGQLTINSGSLTVGNGLRVGGSSSSKRSGQLFVNGGIINAPSYLAVGYGPSGTSNVTGWLDMNAGTINAGTFDIGRVSGTNGYADISGGTIYANSFRMKPAGGAGTVLLDITGSGKIVINGNVVGTIESYISSGLIKTGGAGYSDFYDAGGSVTYNIGTDKTTLMVPEPATICMLGIGIFGLIRRRK